VTLIPPAAEAALATLDAGSSQPTFSHAANANAQPSSMDPAAPSASEVCSRWRPRTGREHPRAVPEVHVEAATQHFGRSARLGTPAGCCRRPPPRHMPGTHRVGRRRSARRHLRAQVAGDAPPWGMPHPACVPDGPDQVSSWPSRTARPGASAPAGHLELGPKPLAVGPQLVTAGRHLLQLIPA